MSTNRGGLEVVRQLTDEQVNAALARAYRRLMRLGEGEAGAFFICG